MNVYLFELKRTRKNAAFWTTALLCLLVMLMSVVYPVYSESRTLVESVLESFPPEFSAAFGLSIADIFSFGGFYAFAFLYLSLMGGIMAATLGLSTFAREKQNKCTDFLLAKPKNRSELFLSKLLSTLTLLAIANILYIAAFLILYNISEQDAALIGRGLLAASAMFFTQLVLLSVSVFIATFAKRIRSVSSVSMGIAFGGFILTALHSILKEDILRYITPYKYFDVTLAFTEGHFESLYAATAAIITLVLLGASFVRYCRSDVHAV